MDSVARVIEEGRIQGIHKRLLKFSLGYVQRHCYQLPPPPPPRDGVHSTVWVVLEIIYSTAVRCFYTVCV
jgi:hypothetical protein